MLSEKFHELGEIRPQGFTNGRGHRGIDDCRKAPALGQLGVADEQKTAAPRIRPEDGSFLDMAVDHSMRRGANVGLEFPCPGRGDRAFVRAGQEFSGVNQQTLVAERDEREETLGG